MGAGQMIAGDMQPPPDMQPPDKPPSPQNLISPGANHLRRTVDVANEEAQQGEIPTEAAILREHMRA